MTQPFKKATRKNLKLRLLLQGASGSGKTYSALKIATTLGSKVAVIDTEQGSSALYSDKFDFDVMDLPAGYWTPEHYIKAIEYAEQGEYDVLIIDSLSHEWTTILDLHSKMTAENYKQSFTAWGKLTPRHNALVNKILASKLHIIATVRSKQGYVIEENNGKSTPKKVGLEGVQRDNLDYEFTLVFELNERHIATAKKDRSGLFDGRDFEVTEEVGKQLLEWLNTEKKQVAKPDEVNITDVTPETTQETKE